MLTTHLQLMRSGVRITQYAEMSAQARRGLEQLEGDLRNASALTWNNASDVTLTIPLEGLVDTSAEKSRLQNEIKRVRTDVEFSLKRLENPAFVEKAKPELVDKERGVLAVNKEKLAVLEEALKRLG